MLACCCRGRMPGAQRTKPPCGCTAAHQRQRKAAAAAACMGQKGRADLGHVIPACYRSTSATRSPETAPAALPKVASLRTLVAEAPLGARSHPQEPCKAQSAAAPRRRAGLGAVRAALPPLQASAISEAMESRALLLPAPPQPADSRRQPRRSNAAAATAACRLPQGQAQGHVGGGEAADAAGHLPRDQGRVHAQGGLRALLQYLLVAQLRSSGSVAFAWRRSRRSRSPQSQATRFCLCTHLPALLPSGH